MCWKAGGALFKQRLVLTAAERLLGQAVPRAVPGPCGVWGAPGSSAPSARAVPGRVPATQLPRPWWPGHQPCPVPACSEARPTHGTLPGMELQHLSGPGFYCSRWKIRVAEPSRCQGVCPWFSWVSQALGWCRGSARPGGCARPCQGPHPLTGGTGQGENLLPFEVSKQCQNCVTSLSPHPTG